MPFFIKKPVKVEAHQWHKNGDHPLDNCIDIPSGRSEGKIVRYYRSPKFDGDAVCTHDGRFMRDHGFMDTSEGGHVVCPGDWIITGIMGEMYPCKPNVFALTYDLVTEGE